MPDEVLHESSEVLTLDVINYPAQIENALSSTFLSVSLQREDVLVYDAHDRPPKSSGTHRNGKDC